MLDFDKSYCAILRMTIILLCYLLAGTTWADSITDSPERIIWRKTPITLPLVVGQERLVHFQGSVSLGVPQPLNTSLRSQSINGTLYLLATRAFSSTRVLVRSESGGPIYVLDLLAQPAGQDQPPLPQVSIMLDSSFARGGQAPDSIANQSALMTGTNPSATQSQTTALGYVALTRYAAQQLYAPTRLIQQRSGVVAMPLVQEPVDMMRGGGVEALPMMSWKAGRYYVTAVKLINRSSAPLVLDPRRLRGAWLAATFQHNRLHPSGSGADTTALYLVSDRPFAVAQQNG